LKYANTAIKVIPLFPDSYEAMAEVYKKEGEYEKAIEWYRKQYKIQSDSPGPMADIADIYSKQKKYDLAVDAYNEAIKILPNEWELHFKLAQLYEKLDKRKEALAEYELAVQWFYDENKSKDYLTAVEKVKELSK